MRTLYESILDDEDVLIKGVKQGIDNPLIKLCSFYKKTSNLRDNMHEVLRIAYDLMDTLKLSKYTVKVYDNRINIYDPKYEKARDAIIRTPYANTSVINPRYIMLQIRFDDEDYITKKGAKCVIILTSKSRKLKSHTKALNEFAEKYNLELSPLENRYILW